MDMDLTKGSKVRIEEYEKRLVKLREIMAFNEELIICPNCGTKAKREDIQDCGSCGKKACPSCLDFGIGFPVCSKCSEERIEFLKNDKWEPYKSPDFCFDSRICKDCGSKVLDFINGLDVKEHRPGMSYLGDYYVLCLNPNCKNHYGEGYSMDDLPDWTD